MDKRCNEGAEASDGELALLSQDALQAIARAEGVPLVVTDPAQADNPIVYANQAFLDLTGYAAGDVLGRNCRFMQGPETDPRALELLRVGLAGKQETVVELLNYRRDGTPFWNELVVAPVSDGKDGVRYYIGLSRDVTRRREADQSLYQAQKMDALGQLTGGLAHDLHNLLQVMVGYLDMIRLQNGREQPDPRRIQRSVENALGAADRARTLTQQLLAFSRRQKLEARSTDLNALLQDMQPSIQRILGTDVALEARLAPDLWSCKVDPLQAESALRNLLLNAYDALAGVSPREVRISTENAWVASEDVGLGDDLQPGPYVCVSVTDSGAGIPFEHLGRVIDPFFTTKGAGPGSGLGLSMVYGFARQSGGTLRVLSGQGIGTTVSLFFPKAEEQRSTDAAIGAACSMESVGQGERVLVVEDRADVAELAQVMLEEAGYATLVAYDAVQALNVLEKHPVDLLFTDLSMPGEMNGVTLAREAVKRHPGLRVLLTTGYADAELARTDGDGKRFETLPKPYGHDDLLRRVRCALETSYRPSASSA